jgi:hypothetical protein
LVFEYIEKNLLEVLEENNNGIDVRYTLIAIYVYSPNDCGSSYTRWSRV